MRTRVPVLATLAVVVALGAVLFAPPATAAGSPAVSGVEVAGSAPGGLVRATGTGFTPGSRVTATVTSAGATLPLAVARADGAGTVVLPASTRVPGAASPGLLEVEMTDAAGLSATGRVYLATPRAVVNTGVEPGDPNAGVYLEGLDSSPGVGRRVTLDGAPVAVTWFSDARAFADPHVHFAYPADLSHGNHRVTFRQAGATPIQITATVVVGDSWILPRARSVAPSDHVDVSISGIGWDDVWHLDVVGAAGDRHDLGDFPVSAIETQNFADVVVDLPGVSAGTARFEGFSRHNDSTATGTVLVDPTSLSTGSALGPDQRIVTADGDTEIRMQTDGNVVERTGRPLGAPGWSTGTQGHPGSRLVLQTDGNLVVRDPAGRALWSTGTSGTGAGGRFGFDPQRDPAVYAASGRQTWSAFRTTSPSTTRLVGGDVLFKGRSLTSADDAGPGGRLDLVMRSDGALVLVSAYDGLLWQTPTTGHPNAYLTLQTDGNLVLRAASGAALWVNGARASGATLVAQDDGNVVERDARGRAVWSTGTHVA